MSPSRLMSAGSEAAALLCSTSRPPKCFAAASIIAITEASSATSATWPTARPPAASISFATASAPAPFTSATTTAAPSRASSSAVARPMPDAAPVTIATLPASLPRSIRLP